MRTRSASLLVILLAGLSRPADAQSHRTPLERCGHDRCAAGSIAAPRAANGVVAVVAPSAPVNLEVRVEADASLPVEVVRRVLLSRRPMFAQCLQRASATSATVVTRFTITRTRTPAPRIDVVSVAGPDEGLRSCVRARVGTLVFPQPTLVGPVRVELTLRR